MNTGNDFDSLISNYLKPAFTWLDENQLWLGCSFGLTLFCTVLSKKEQRNFWGKLLVPQLMMTLFLIRAPFTQGFWDWLGISISQNYPLDWISGAIMTLSVGSVS